MTAKKFVEDNYNAEVIYGDTDSIFCKFPLKDSNSNPVYGKQALKYAIETGIKVEKEIAKIMPYPQKLNYEKSLYPFIILSKKRYVGNLYEFDINKFKQKSMGIVLKRRDNANIVKKIYGGIIDILLNKQDLNASIEFLNDELNDLVNGKSNINDLIISKSLRASYKDPSKIAHKVLADRIGSRDPGNKPAVNDRVPYVYIKLDKIDKTTLQGDRIENPEYIVENSLIPDYLHYITNQIMKPVLQLYALSLEELPNYNKESDYWEKINEELKLKPIYLDDIKRKNRIENLRLQLVKELLFDKYIDQLSEPKIKKTTKKTSRILSSEKTEKEEKTNNCEILNEDTIINLLKSKESLVDLKVSAPQNAPKQTIEVRCKVIVDKKTILDNKNICISNKNKEITNSIITLIEYFENNNIEKVINIKLNNKPFIKSYKKAVLDYKEFEKNENLDNNLVQDAINTNDIGRMKSAISVLEYGKLLMKNHKFSFIE